MPTLSSDDLIFELALGDMEPPTGQADLLDWLDERERWLANASRRAVKEVLRPALRSYADSLTAAGDLAVFDGLTVAWEAFIANVAGEYIGGMHLAGSVSTVQAAARAGVVLGPEFAALLNEWAGDYLTTISGQLNGYGAEIIAEATANAEAALGSAATKGAIDEAIRDITGRAEGAAEYVMRNEVIAAYNRGHMQSARNLGDGAPVEKVWLATLDARTRPDHLDANDQVVPMSEPFLVGGEQLDAPHDGGGSPAQVANCRCTVLFLYPGDERPDGSIVPGGDEWASRTDQLDDDE